MPMAFPLIIIMIIIKKEMMILCNTYTLLCNIFVNISS